MKKICKILGVCTAFIVITGCNGGKVQYVDNKDSIKYTSTAIDYHDIEAAASESIQSLLRSPYVIGLDPTKRKVLAISDVVNDTMQRVDVKALTTNIAQAMRNSGRFRVTAAISGSGGSTDNMIKKAREARDDDEFNQYTTQEKGQLIAPDLSLSGEIVQNNTRVGKQQRIDYSFRLTLTDLRTGIAEWSESKHIIKVAPNKKVSW